MLFLVTIKANRGKWQEVAVVASYDDAVAAVERHVGEHNEVDGCSTPVQKWFSGDMAEPGTGVRCRMSRGTSFGERSGTVTALLVGGNFVDFQ